MRSFMFVNSCRPCVVAVALLCFLTMSSAMPGGGLHQRLGLESKKPRTEASPVTGGIRQRMVNTALAPAAELNPLAEAMKKEWAKGKLSSTQVQDFAMSAYSGGDRHDSTAALSRAANEGQNPKNLYRALCKAVSYTHLTLPTKRIV